METVKLGKSNLELTRLGLGTAALGGLYTSVNNEDAANVVAAAVNAGINYFDTAPLYGHGLSEVRLGRALRESGKKFIISTKVGRVLNPADKAQPSWLFADADPRIEATFDWSPNGVRRSLLESLERLGLDRVDIVHMHDADDHLYEAIHTTFPVLADLRAQGIINAIGIGLNLCKPSIKIMNETDLDFALIAGRFTLLDQEAQEELFPLAIKKNVSMLVGGTLNSGVLASPSPGAKFNYLTADDQIIEKVRKIRDFLDVRGIPLLAAAIQFPLRHRAVSTIIAGPRNEAEMNSIIKNFNLVIPEEVWSDLEKAGLLAPIKH
jgi:D-threo-aldose 1-dehydrogenase